MQGKDTFPNRQNPERLFRTQRSVVRALERLVRIESPSNDRDRSAAVTALARDRIEYVAQLLSGGYLSRICTK